MPEYFVKKSKNIFSQSRNIDKRERTCLIATENANKLNAVTVFYNIEDTPKAFSAIHSSLYIITLLIILN